MIDERELLERLGVWYESLFPRTSIRDSIKCDVIDNVMTMIEDAEKVGEWIPVSEGLPEANVNVLVTYKNDDKLIVDTDFWYKTIDTWFYFGEKVIAWKPLPESFKGE